MVAGDKNCLVPPDLEGLRRLAKFVLIQAARDAEGHGPRARRYERGDAWRFFHATDRDTVCVRVLWFSLLGIECPCEADMDKFIGHLLAAGKRERYR